MARRIYPLFVVLALAVGTATAVGLGEQTVTFPLDASDSVFPQWQGHWTGFVACSAGVYQKQPTSIATISARNNSASSERGWAKFDLTLIPDDAVVSAAAVRYSASQIQPNGASVELRLVTADPVAEQSGAVLWQQMTTGELLSEALPIPYQTVPLSVVQELNSTAVAALQSRLAVNWFVLGLNETQTGADVGGQMYGWNNSSRRPRLIVTYTVPVDIRTLSCGTSTYPLVAGALEQVWARVVNYGTTTATATRVTATVDNAPFDSLLLGALAPGRETLVTFQYHAPAGTPARRYFAVAATNAAEQVHSNDTARFNDWVFPARTWTAEGFDLTSQSLPPGWVALSADGGSYTWARASGAMAHSGSWFARAVFEPGRRTDDWLVSPPLTLPADFADSLGFFVRTQGATPPDTFEVWTMAGPSISDTLSLLLRTLVGSVAHQELGASLEDHAGSTIRVGLRKVGVSLNQLVLDDFWCSRQPSEDAGVAAVLQPSGTVYEGAYVRPQAVLRNWGICSITFDAQAEIRSESAAVYAATQTGLTLGAGDSMVLTFATAWTAVNPGGYSCVVRTVASHDQDPTNDSLAVGFSVVLVPGCGWEELASITAEPSSKAVKDGGWLAWVPALGRVLAAKGNKTSDFYGFDPEQSRWQTCAPVPPGDKSAGYFGRGGAACSDGALVYAVKGSNSLEFWRYDPGLDTWNRLRDVPAGPNKKAIKGGGDIVCANPGGGTRVYALKGPSAEFFAYIPALDSWEQLPPAPNPSCRWDRGSFLVYDGDRTIYAHKARYHEFWTYDISNGTWSAAPLTGMPLIGVSGRSRKAKDGSAGAWLDNSLYALKGGNTQELWRYLPWSDTWTELEPIPAYGRAGCKKMVKDGGDVVSVGSRLYALKGNRSLEFWSYRPNRCAGAGPKNAGPAASATAPALRSRFSATSVVTGANLKLRFELGAPAEVDARLYDASGRSVLHQSLGPMHVGTALLDVRRLPSGVYALRLAAGDWTATRRVILDR